MLRRPKESLILQSNNKKMPIKIADKPLRMGGKVEQIKREIFEKKLGINYYSEKIDLSNFHELNKLQISDNITGDLSSTQLKAQLDKIILNPRDDLVLCKMKDVGYGVFSLNNIDKDTVLCFYSGSLVHSITVGSSDNHAINYFGLNVSFSTQTHRGISSFFQHLPKIPKISDPKQLCQILKMMGQQVSEEDLKLNDELYAIEFLDDNVRQTLATANIREEYVNYNGVPVVLLVTDRAIKAGEQLGFNYGKDYWLSRMQVPELFNQNGQIIPSNAYRRQFGRIKLDESIYTGDLMPLVQQIKADAIQVKLIDDKKHHIIFDTEKVMKELIKVRAITKDEYQHLNLKLNSFLPKKPNTFFDHGDLSGLCKRYNLPDCSRLSLEKGLRLAAVNNKIEDLKKLVKAVNVNAQDDNPDVQRTALHWAAIKGHSECYKILLDAGADPLKIKDKKGKNANEYLLSFGTNLYKPPVCKK